MISIPVMQNVSARYKLDMNFNSTTFNLAFYWSTREATWYMDLMDSNSNAILMGIKLVPSIVLLRQYPFVRIILGGDFYLLDLSASPQTSDLTYDNFGNRYILNYLTEAELISGVVS